MMNNEILYSKVFNTMISFLSYIPVITYSDITCFIKLYQLKNA